VLVRRRSALLIAALAVTGLSMRTAVTSVGAALDDVEAGLHTSSGIAGVITTLPVICFAGIGALAPRLSHRYGPHRLVVVALLAMTAGLVLRALVGSLVAFLLLSVLALTGGAITNVLLPSLVKAHFPDRIGPMTAVYTTALAIGTTLAAGLTIPIGSLSSGAHHGWRLGLGSWAVLSALAVLPWLPTLRHDAPEPDSVRGPGIRRLARSRTVWALTVLFAFQAFQAYIAFGWFAKFMNAHGVSAGTAGWMVALLSAVTIPASMVVPSVPPHRHRATLIVLCSCYLLGYVGLAVAPVGGAWAWMVLTGIGSAQFPLALAMIGLRARSADTTASLSAFVQSIGYLVAGSGPLLFGVLHGATGSWGLPLALLFAALFIALIAGWRSARPCYVEDEL
jgi:CP family cyanate transporter-like MFS transporter